MKRAEVHKIGPHDARFETLLAGDQTELLKRLTALLGEPVVQAIVLGASGSTAVPDGDAGQPDSAGPPAGNAKMLAQTLGTLFARIGETDVDSMFRLALKNTVVSERTEKGGIIEHNLADGTQYDLFFSGEIEWLLDAFVTAVKVNFRPFSKALKWLEGFGTNYLQALKTFQGQQTSDSPNSTSSA